MKMERFLASDIIRNEEIKRKFENRIEEIHETLHSGKLDFSGWVEYPENISSEMLDKIVRVAGEVRKKCTAFVIIGIGGSYLGARSAIELLNSPLYNEKCIKNRVSAVSSAKSEDSAPKIYYAGHHVSSIYYNELFKYLKDESICICVISKSGSTLEPFVIFELFKKFMRTKYSENEMNDRIYTISDESCGRLRRETEEKGYENFAIPGDIGGRYSVLTPVGLFPMAVSGIDVRRVIHGARGAQERFCNTDITENECYRYACLRAILAESGKIIEVFEAYEGRLRYFTEWLKQLYGESECKDKGGILPISLQMSTDLHSMGQFLQDGRQNFFETVIAIDDVPEPVSIKGLDGIDMSDDITDLHELNNYIMQSVRNAHIENDTSNIILRFDNISPEVFGQMAYFFEKSCAVSALLQGVNPFDQPGVEAYKHNIKEKLNVK